MTTEPITLHDTFPRVEPSCPPAERVDLICLPFQVTGLSSLSTALLTTYLRRREFQVQDHYLHFPFAELMGSSRYREISESATLAQIGELLFAEGLHGRIGDSEALRRLNELFGDAEVRRDLRSRFLDSCLERLGAVDGGLVGFTTTSQQLLPALWLARALKKREPATRTVFGGAACSEPMGRVIFDSYPGEVDYVVSGYGERLLLDLARGAIRERRALLSDHQPPDLDELPVPDYERFLAQAGPEVERPGGLMLAFETSRGCWWGQKSHCGFCGLNQLELDYNAKTSERSFAEIRDLWERFGFNLFATDTILARSHLKEVLPRLAEFSDKPSIFYEVKSNMRRAEVTALKAANVQWVQPGIESLSTPLLRHLRKGVTAIQNLAFLKWCREDRVLVSWNLLCGIPGEEPVHYESQLELFPLIPHLSPPQSVSPVRLDRYSPYFTEYRKFGWKGVRPFSIYRSLHPHLDEDDLESVAYHFEGSGLPSCFEEYFSRLQAAIDAWRRLHDEGDGLFWDRHRGLVRIHEGQARLYGRSKTLAAVLQSADGVIGGDQLLALEGVDQDFLDELIAEGILYREGRKYLSLAVHLPEEFLPCPDRA